jgi:hypothetical protein
MKTALKIMSAGRPFPLTSWRLASTSNKLFVHPIAMVCPACYNRNGCIYGKVVLDFFGSDQKDSTMETARRGTQCQ